LAADISPPTASKARAPPQPPSSPSKRRPRRGGRAADRQQLSVALANLVTQRPDWPDSLEKAMHRLGSPETALSLLELFKHLAEEVTDWPVSMSTQARDRAYGMLTGNAERVYSILAELYAWAQAPERRDLGTLRLVFVCFAQWVPLLYRVLEVLVSPSSKLAQGLFDNLKHRDLFRPCADALTGILELKMRRRRDPEYSSPADCVVYEQCFHFIMPRLVGLRADYHEAVRQGDEEVSRRLAVLFVTAADAYSEWTLRRTDHSVGLLELLLEATYHPTRRDTALWALYYWEGWGRPLVDEGKRMKSADMDRHGVGFVCLRVAGPRVPIAHDQPRPSADAAPHHRDHDAAGRGGARRRRVPELLDVRECVCASVKTSA